MSRLILALPSKGRLQEQTVDRFAASGLAIVRDGARGYSARLPAAPMIDVRLLSASEIARALRDGDVHLGVTGEDLLREMGEGFQRVALLEALGFGRADVVVAVPAGWLDVTTMADLERAAASLRARTGRRLRVATKFIALTRQFFASHGFDDYRIVESLGATEGAPAAGAADIIVDITTTGATLKANHLRTLSDGVILRSQAQLAASIAAAWDGEALAALADLLAIFAAQARAGAGRVIQLDGLSEGQAAALMARYGFSAEGGVLRYRGPADAAVWAAQAARGAGATGASILAETHAFADVHYGFLAFQERLAAAHEQQT
jgi:ATP phosphoribosyltransferase